jgi:hypothetical protein
MYGSKHDIWTRTWKSPQKAQQKEKAKRIKPPISIPTTRHGSIQQARETREAVAKINQKEAFCNKPNAMKNSNFHSAHRDHDHPPLPVSD